MSKASRSSAKPAESIEGNSAGGLGSSDSGGRVAEQEIGEEKTVVLGLPILLHRKVLTDARLRLRDLQIERNGCNEFRGTAIGVLTLSITSLGLD